ncbi:helix-turn-helix domain-containing protein [Enterococcus durans]|uniref:XRE family transcriptional regulator n=1 Tax=Enterococcus durans TaxID=53345 RepID=UPI0011BE9F56|nr:XRE family transcriptional regulator [Enterococcus durans]NJE62913.1 helix-turn-helix domain-containing protein [Enterococcus durans]QED60284.1 helix-turn-helix domain-containing protein [Enterococcus durans]QED62833.1 helix-turn-helix domain-containing protein [Enterococcus durans]
MTVGEKMKFRRKELKISADEIAKALGVSRSTIFRYEKGEIEKLPTENLRKIAEVLKTTPEDLMGWTETENNFSIVSIYNQLVLPRQQKVYDFAKNELEEQNRSNIIQGNFGKDIDEDKKQEVSYVGLLSAGYGYPNYDKERPLGTVTMRESQIPSHYDLAFMVDGDSMYPTFENGEIVFIKKTPDVMNGQIGAIEINGRAFLKKMYVENHRLRFVSLNCECDKNGNRLYPDFYADEYDDLYVIGRVIV